MTLDFDGDVTASKKLRMNESVVREACEFCERIK